MISTRILPVALFALLLQSCSCQSRIERLRHDCPQCFLADTIRHTDTITRPGTSIVERIPLRPALDHHPVTVTCPNYTLNISVVGDTLLIDGTTTPDTIVYTADIPVQHPTAPPPKKKPALPLIIAISILLLAAAGALCKPRTKA